MAPAKIDPTITGMVKAYLGLGYSERLIISTIKKQNIKISKGSINKIKKEKDNLLKSNENLIPKKMPMKKITEQKLEKIGTDDHKFKSTNSKTDGQNT